MKMIDDEVDLVEKPEDTRYIKLHRNETRSTGSVGKLNIMDLIPNLSNHCELQTRECAGMSLPDGP